MGFIESRFQITTPTEILKSVGVHDLFSLLHLCLFGQSRTPVSDGQSRTPVPTRKNQTSL